MGRTTLTLDPDVQNLLEDEAHRTRRPFKEVVNDLVRRALAPIPVEKPIYRVVPHHSALAPGIDETRFNQLADDLEVDAVRAKLQRGS